MQESTPSPKYDWFSIVQMGCSVLGAFFLWGMAFIALFFALVNKLSNSIGNSNFSSSFMLASGLIVCGFLLLPSAIYSIKKGFDRSLPTFPISISIKTFAWLIIALPLVLWIGHWLSNQAGFGWVFLPIFHVLALGLPILWVIYLAINHLPVTSQQRRWGLFSTGMILSPTLILFAELVVMVIFVLLVAFLLTNDPELFEAMNQFSQIFDRRNINPEEVYEGILPFLSHPGAFFYMIAFTAVIVPLIEETIKPLGVWFLLNRKLSVSEGFIAGLLCGAGYGWIENIALTYSSQEWLVTVTGRMGTSLIHMATAGLTGYALVNAWNNKKYLQLGGAFLLAVLVHGLWNGLAVSYAFASLLNKNAPILVERLGLAAPLGLFVLAITTFLIIVGSNRRLQKQADHVSDDTVQPQIQE
ncbi:MAG: PrsW family intramembrane metalloprotease [Anaerolineales bacterium]|nr:PrsW family intramembrane metalloprotease [Anaerolineales bacterium]